MYIIKLSTENNFLVEDGKSSFHSTLQHSSRNEKPTEYNTREEAQKSMNSKGIKFMYRNATIVQQ